jgi:hypothetical protein
MHHRFIFAKKDESSKKDETSSFARIYRKRWTKIEKRWTKIEKRWNTYFLQALKGVELGVSIKSIIFGHFKMHIYFLYMYPLVDIEKHIKNRILTISRGFRKVYSKKINLTSIIFFDLFSKFHLFSNFHLFSQRWNDEAFFLFINLYNFYI